MVIEEEGWLNIKVREERWRKKREVKKAKGVSLAILKKTEGVDRRRSSQNRVVAGSG